MNKIKDKEICVECGRSVAIGSGYFVNRIPVLDEYADRGFYNYPKGGWICAECDKEIRDEA